MTDEKKPLPYGISDFKKLIEGNFYYVDKSLFIKELLKEKTEVNLIPRPRRFGKTLNMSMLRYFFEANPRSPDQQEQQNRHLFEHLAISTFPTAMAHQGQYPVIFISLKDVHQKTWGNCYEQIKKILSEEFRRHKYVLESDALDPDQKRDFQEILQKTASEEVCRNALADLLRYLYQYYQKPAIVLIDEYDAVIHAAHLYNSNQEGSATCHFYTDAIDFMRSFLGGGLKDSTILEFAVVTGILRVAKESIFSGLNNLAIETFLSNFYADKFGFTEPEVAALRAYYNLPQTKDEMRDWYDGYQSGEHCVYTPWSIINIARYKILQAYWTKTAQENIIRRLVEPGNTEQRADLSILMSGGTIEKKIDENIAFERVDTHADALWNLLLFSGYLTFSSITAKQAGRYAQLKIPNREIAELYFSSIQDWFYEQANTKNYFEILKKLVAGDTQEFKELFTDFVRKSLSTFDIRKNEPENFYHALVLGMLIGLHETHEIKSNRESGTGRYDVVLIPKDHQLPGIIFECCSKVISSSHRAK